MSAPLVGDGRGRLAGAGPVHPEAYEDYLKGRHCWNTITEEGIRKGIYFFENAIEKDPSYAAAHAGLADAYLRLLDYNHVPSGEALSRANAAATRALELSEPLPEAHTSLGHIRLHEWDWPGAEREFDRAIKLNPNYAAAHYYYGNYLLAAGGMHDAVGEARRALELDPVSLLAHSNAAIIAFHAGRYSEAIELCSRALELDPTFARAYCDLGRIYEQKELYGEAIKAFEKALTLSSGTTRYRVALGHAWAVVGKNRRALKLLAELKHMSVERYVSPFAGSLQKTIWFSATPARSLLRTPGRPQPIG